MATLLQNKKHRIALLLVASFFILVAGSAYLHQLFGIGITGAAMFATICLVGTYILSLLIIRNVFIRAFRWFLVLFVLVYTVINGLFFQVFNTLLIDLTEKIGKLPIMFKVLVKFAGDIPLINYGYIALILTLLIALETYIIKQTQIQHTQKNIIAIAAIFLFFLPVPFFAYLEIHPKDTWWNPKTKAQNIGISGHIYTQLLTTVIPQSTYQAEGDTPVQKTKSLLEQLKSTQTAGISQKDVATPSTTPHIIIYQLESVGSWGIEGHKPHPMPFLQSLTQRSISPTKGFPNSCHTVNAEFAILCSAYVDAKGAISASGEQNEYHCLPHILKERYGYTSSLYHSNRPTFWSRHILGPAWGFDQSHFSPEYDVRYPDRYILQDIVSNIEKADTPTLQYLIGYTSHAPHSPEQMTELNELFDLNITMYEGEADPAIVENVELNEFAVNAYVGFLQEIDDTIKQLFEQLQEKKLDDNTIVVITGDHRYYNFPEQTAENFIRYNQVPLVIVTPNNTTRTTNIASHVDIAPTILELLEGEDTVFPETFFGTSLLTETASDFAYMKCINDIGFINNHTIIRGSAENNLYNTLLPDKNSEEYKQILRELTVSTDQLIYENLLNKKHTD